MATASNFRLKLNTLHQRIELAIERGFLLTQVTLRIAQRGQLGFRRRQLARVLLNLILLSVDAVQALYIAADAGLILCEARDFRFGLPQGRVVASYFGLLLRD